MVGGFLLVVVLSLRRRRRWWWSCQAFRQAFLRRRRAVCSEQVRLVGASVCEVLCVERRAVAVALHKLW